MNDIQDISTSMALSSTPWDNLSMAEKAEMMRVAVNNGITNLQDIQSKYNRFAEGGHVYEVLPKLLKDAGLDVRVTSGYRKPGQAGKAGSKSWHTRHGAVDIVPQGKTTFADIEHALYNNPVISDYMLSNGFGLIDESGRTAESKATMRKTGATGAHFHIGKDSVYAKKYASKFQAAPVIQPQMVLPTELALPSIPTSSTLPIQPIEYTPVYYPKAETTTTTAVPTNSYNEAALAAEEKRNRLNALNLILSMTNNNGQNDSFLNTLSVLNSIPYATGGKIHIKPENRGKFTALKERTGHSATWFKEHGTPAQKKMATFALNARHWKHGLGGNLYPVGGFMGLMPIVVPAALKGIGNAVKERAYKTITPQSYNISKAAKEFISGKERNLNGIEPERNEEWARYLGVPYNGESNFEPSPYRPQKGKTYDTVLRFKDESKILSDDVLNQMLNRQRKTGKNSWLVTGNGGGLGTYTLSLGEDEKGKYISYYDDWDINPFKGISARTKIPFISTIEDIVPGSNPFTVYGRRYYEETNSKKHNLGGNLFS